jgi:hypothetical protein
MEGDPDLERAERHGDGRADRCQASAGATVKDQPELRQGSGDAGTSSITRNTTSGGPPGIRTPNLRIKSLV